MLDSLEIWDGPRDELNGRVEAVEPAADGTIRVRVLDLWLAFPVPVPGGS
jgi:hypothetical protein